MQPVTEAGIGWYVLVEPDTATLHLFELGDSAYVERSVTEVGETLRLAEPMTAVIDPADLLPAR